MNLLRLAILVVFTLSICLNFSPASAASPGIERPLEALESIDPRDASAIDDANEEMAQLSFLMGAALSHAEMVELESKQLPGTWYGPCILARFAIEYGDSRAGMFLPAGALEDLTSNALALSVTGPPVVKACMLATLESPQHFTSSSDAECVDALNRLAAVAPETVLTREAFLEFHRYWAPPYFSTGNGLTDPSEAAKLAHLWSAPARALLEKDAALSAALDLMRQAVALQDLVADPASLADARLALLMRAVESSGPAEFTRWALGVTELIAMADDTEGRLVRLECRELWERVAASRTNQTPADLPLSEHARYLLFSESVHARDYSDAAERLPGLLARAAAGDFPPDLARRLPARAIELGMTHVRDGDYESAIAIFQALETAYAGTELAARCEEHIKHLDSIPAARELAAKQ